MRCMVSTLLVTVFAFYSNSATIDAETFRNCITPNMEPSQCTYLKSCESLFSLSQKQPLTEDDRVHLQRSECGFKEGRPLVCCPPPVTVTEQQPNPTWTEVTSDPAIDGQTFGDCITPNKESGQCIYLKSCEPLLSLIQKNPLQNEDKVHLQRSFCGGNKERPLVCCPPPVTVTEQQPNPTWTEVTSDPAIDGQTFGDCITPNKEPSQCTYRESCESLFSLSQKQLLTEDDLVHLQQSECGFKEGRVLVCCPPPVTVTEQQPKPIGTQETYEPGNVLPQPGTCGSSSTYFRLSNRISGGDMTAIDEFPWVVLLQYFKSGNTIGFLCSGVLINSRYVLTASHCVINKDFPADWNLGSVRLGEWNTSSANDCEEGVCSTPPLDVTIEEHIPHEDYNEYSKNQVHDIALLRLSKSIPYSKWIMPICLPTEPHLRRETFEGFDMDIVGWGMTENKVLSDIKLKARVSGVDLKKCNEVYKSACITLYFTQLCASGEIGIDSCQGDSGGPLMGLDESGREPYFFLAGIVSFGTEQCALKGWPSVYTRVGTYIDWIKNNIRP